MSLKQSLILVLKSYKVAYKTGYILSIFLNQYE